MTAIDPTPRTDTGEQADRFDVLIIGAGISGIGAAYRIRERNPGVSYAILEQRERIGGTWDLFRYPGVRSDSSIFGLSLPYEPWTRREGVADGEHIREYLTEVARKHGIDRHIRFGNRVHTAEWDSNTDTWTLRADERGTEKVYRARFVFFGSGYYNYDEPYHPEFVGINEFQGPVVNPQHWPEDLDYAGKRIVVIGSGATAVTLVPALARTADKVVMLQRSPTYIAPAPRVHRLTSLLRKVLPLKVSHQIARRYHSLVELVTYLLCQTFPTMTRGYFRRKARTHLPAGYPVDVHFRPKYNPWDQRACLDADADLFTAISEGSVEVVTDHIDRFDATGIWLKSGQHLPADIVVTATGLQLLALGGVRIVLDGTEIKPQDRFAYKACMLEDVPNLAWCIGYTNGSWTLRADLTAQHVAKLLAYMRSHGYTHAYPHRGGEPMAEKLAWDIKANYVLRSPHALPKSGTKRPWIVRQNFFLDTLDHRFDRIEEDMIFGRVAQRSALSA
jgi:cation diffusion facilitator CzcD-associated flavoprotein CzcO